MPAINVARTDTFEQQRVKINEIGAQIFNISAGGSDLSTGNLKLGDGTRLVPSLAFVSDSTLGLYKSDTGQFGFVSNQKKINDFSSLENVFYKNTVVRLKQLQTDLLSVLNVGSNYDPGSYNEVPLRGGSGDNSTASITVESFDGSITTIGRNYTPGTYTTIELTGGTGSGTFVGFEIPLLTLEVTNAGSAYAPGTYQNVPLTGGTGSNGTVNVTITGDTILSGSITNPGSGYAQGVYTTELFNTPRQTFVVTANGSTDYLIDGNTAPTLNLEKGNTYRFDVSDASNVGHAFQFRDPVSQESLNSQYYYTVRNGTDGNAGAFYDVVILPNAPTETVEYYCVFHPNSMNGDANIAVGTTGDYGNGANALVSVDVSGAVTNVTFTESGRLYFQNDVLTVPALGGSGSGFQYTLNAPIHNGTVGSVEVVSSGINYVAGDVLSVNDSDLGGGGGSGLQLTALTTPGALTEFVFSTKGVGYTVGDVLTLPGGTTTTGYTEGQVSGVSATTTASTTVTVSSTTGISPGMLVTADELSTAQFPPQTTVVSITNSTTIVVSNQPSVTGSGVLSFTSTNPTTEVQVSSVTGIVQGQRVSVTSGDGAIPIGATVTAINEVTNVVTISSGATSSGFVNLSFDPTYGSPTTPVEFTIDALGTISEISILEGGNGYSVGDELTVNPFDLTTPIQYSVDTTSTQKIVLSGTIPSATFAVGDLIKRLDSGVESFSYSGGTNIPAEAGNSYSSVSGSSSGSGTGATFTITRAAAGAEGASAGDIESVTLINSGNSYALAETITIPGASIGGSTPTDNLTITVDGITSETSVPIELKRVAGSNISYLIVGENDFVDGDVIAKDGTVSPTYTIQTASVASPKLRFIDEVGTSSLIPNLTLYVGNTYEFSLNAGADLQFSLFPDGDNPPSKIESVSTTLDVASKQITVPSTTGIAAGMSVTINLVGSTGNIIDGTTVESVDSPTTLTLSSFPQLSGTAILSFSGVPYSDGVTLIGSTLSIKITDATASQLYYYIPGVDNAGGEDNDESTVTIDANNPKTFGSGFLLSVLGLNSVDVFSANIDTGLLSTRDIESTGTVTSVGLVSSTGNIQTVSSTDITVDQLIGPNNLTITSPQSTFSGVLKVSDKFEVDSVTGDLFASGEIKTTSNLNINDIIGIENNTISTSSGNDLVLDPFGDGLVRVDTSSAFIIPSGDTNQRNGITNPLNGSIRFNTDSNQYEGYSESASTWSSLGGVRDVDGNTYIKAEEFPQSNDNILWFFNDGVNTLKVERNYFSFYNNKKIRSLNTSTPTYTNWAANRSVSLGDYLKYQDNLYVVTAAGQLGGSADGPTDTSGTPFANGTAELNYYSTAIAPVTFEEISEIRIGPNRSVPMIFQNDLRITKNTISTDVTDIILKPNTGRRVICDTKTHLQIPSGTENEKSTGTAALGSIRYNTTLSTYEGYIGNDKWGSLGGVKDVDGNTYIIPETAPAANENILYFYNDNINTINVSTTEVDFANIDTITSSGSDALEITASTITFDNNSTTLDNTTLTSTRLSTTKDNLDFGLSTGLTVDTLLRLDDQGDIYYNTGFGEASANYVRLFDKDLSNIEISKYRITTSNASLLKGTTNNGSAVIYAPSTELSAKIELVAHNTTTGAKEVIEFSVIDNGSDIFYTEVGTIQSNGSLITYTFDFNVNNAVRLNYSLATGVANANAVNVTVVSNVIKK